MTPQAEKRSSISLVPAPAKPTAGSAWRTPVRPEVAATLNPDFPDIKDLINPQTLVEIFDEGRCIEALALKVLRDSDRNLTGYRVRTRPDAPSGRIDSSATSPCDASTCRRA